MTVQTASTHVAPLSRGALAARSGSIDPIPPVRIVHIGLGSFHRSHQAWYTSESDAAAEWGIAAFTGRNPEMADLLQPQDGLYTLIERAETGDSARVVQSIVEVRDGADLARFTELVADPAVSIVTLTITESGYRLTPEGILDLDDGQVAEDVVSLRAILRSPDHEFSDRTAPRTALGRLLLGLDSRRRCGSGAIAVVPCDNIPDNGQVVRRAVLVLADLVSPVTGRWVRDNVSFVSTSVDRITPQVTAADLQIATELTGWIDSAPVVAEPFSAWVLAGDFPGGRPAWESAGAQFVENVEPFERRKLWLLNGAHSLLAYAGRLRGHRTVAEAISDPVCRFWVESFWDEASRHLPDGLELDTYRASLLERFGNSRIEHRLDQIGAEAVLKLRTRIVEVARGELAAGRSADASARVIAAWISLVQSGTQLQDSAESSIDRTLASGWTVGTSGALVALVDEELADNSRFMSAIETALAEKETP